MKSADQQAEERDREEAVEQINDLWPPDAERDATQIQGQIDMMAALCAEWRSLPVPVLQHMARAQHFRDHHG